MKVTICDFCKKEVKLANAIELYNNGFSFRLPKRFELCNKCAAEVDKTLVKMRNQMNN